MPKYIVTGCVKRWEQECNILIPVKLSCELGFRNHTSHIQSCSGHLKLINVTKKDVCIFTFIPYWININIYLCMPVYIHLPTSQLRNRTFLLPMKLSLCPSLISFIFLFSQTPLHCIFCLSIACFYLLFCDIYLYF